MKRIALAGAVGALTVAGGLVVAAAEGRSEDRAGGGFPDAALRLLRSILADTRTAVARLHDLGIAVEDLQFTAEEARDACAPPDLLPVPLDFPQQGYCRLNEAGNLVVRVKNQGGSDATSSTLRVTFDVGGSGVSVDAATPAIPWGGFTRDVEIPGGLPSGCGEDSEGVSACNFQIAVDVADAVRPEASQDNNNAVGACLSVQ